MSAVDDTVACAAADPPNDDPNGGGCDGRRGRCCGDAAAAPLPVPYRGVPSCRAADVGAASCPGAAGDTATDGADAGGKTATRIPWTRDTHRGCDNSFYPELEEQFRKIVCYLFNSRQLLIIVFVILVYMYVPEVR